MKKEYLSPKIKEEQVGKCDPHDVYEHDAFATINMTTRTGGNRALFGSDTAHNQTVCISIQRAKLDRHLSRDWIHGETMPIIEIEMSHSQFAQFITSNGNGSGTPCTLAYAPAVGTPTECMPGISPIESKTETFRREIKESASKQIEKIQAEIKKLGDLIESGKTSKKELRELQFNLKNQVENLPDNMEFTVKQAEKALESATNHAKIEIEAFLDHTHRKIGMAAAEKMGWLTNKEGEKNINLDNLEVQPKV
jgi:ElaB/YqjD/DUF883 family membrane-anchored ribosome-binding protein